MLWPYDHLPLRTRKGECVPSLQSDFSLFYTNTSPAWVRRVLKHIFCRIISTYVFDWKALQQGGLTVCQLVLMVYYSLALHPSYRFLHSAFFGHGRTYHNRKKQGRILKVRREGLRRIRGKEKIFCLTIGFLSKQSRFHLLFKKMSLRNDFSPFFSVWGSKRSFSCME